MRVLYFGVFVIVLSWIAASVAITIEQARETLTTPTATIEGLNHD